MRLSMRRSLTPVLVAVRPAVASGAIWLDWRLPYAGRRAIGRGPDSGDRPFADSRARLLDPVGARAGARADHLVEFGPGEDERGAVVCCPAAAQLAGLDEAVKRRPPLLLAVVVGTATASQQSQAV